LQAQLHSKQLEIKQLRGGKAAHEEPSQISRNKDTDIENPDQHKVNLRGKSNLSSGSSEQEKPEQIPTAKYSQPTAILFLPPHVTTRPTYFK
jgi:hypothetical protein